MRARARARERFSQIVRIYILACFQPFLQNVGDFPKNVGDFPNFLRRFSENVGVFLDLLDGVASNIENELATRCHEENER